MARHRNIRALDADQEYDDFYACSYGQSVEDEFCVSPSTEAQFMYNRSTKDRRTTGSSFASTEEGEEDISEEENYPENDLNISGLDAAKLQSCIEAMQDVVGETIPESVLRKAAVNHNFDLEKSLNAVLVEKAPKPQRSRKREPTALFIDAPDTNNKPSVSNETPNTSNKLEKLPISSKTPSKITGDKATPNNKTLVEKESADALQSNIVPSESLNKPAKVEDYGSEGPEANRNESTSKSSEKIEDKLTCVRNKKAENNGKEIYHSERGNEKPLINLVVIGHVDAGKSTLMGHLLYSLGNISQRNMHKFERDSKKLGKGSFMYAWVLDETPEERNRGITMDVAFSSFETPHRSITLLDAPGHKDFIPNMITGAAQADVALLVVDSTRGEFETGFEMGGQTREHTMLIRSLGVNELAVAVNKLDNVGWSEDRFKEIKSKLSLFLKQVGFRESDVVFVPCSGLTGENLVEGPKEEAFKNWYSGKTLVEVIDNFHPPERPVDKPLRMCLSDVFKGTTGGICVAGKIEAGFLKNGDKVLVMPSSENAVIKGISSDDRTLTHGFAGDHITVQITNVDANNIASGNIICSIESPVKVTSRFEARLVIFNIAVPITKGFPVILHYQSLSEQAVIKKLIAHLNRSTGEVVRKKPRCLIKNSSAIVEIEVNRLICIELFKEFKELGRFMLRCSGATIAAGLVTEIK